MLAILGYPCIYLLLSPTFGHPFGQDAMRPSASPVLLAPAESTHPHLPTAGGPHRSWRHTRCYRKDSRPCCWSQHVSADVADKCHLMSLDKARRVGKGVSHDGPEQQPLYLSILLDWLHWTSLNSASHTDSFTSQLWIVKPQRMLLMSNSVPVLHLPPKASRSCCLSHTKPPRHAAKTPQEKCRDRQHRLLGKAIVPSYTRWAKISGRVSPSSPQLWSLLEAETACCGGQRAYPFEGDIPSGCLNSTAIKPPIP